MGDDHSETLRIYFYPVLYRRSTLRSHDALGSEETTDYSHAFPIPMTSAPSSKDLAVSFGVRNLGSPEI